MPSISYDPLRVVTLTGAPGAGKTEVARRLVGRYRVPAAFIDLDQLAEVRPWRADERFYQLIAANLRAVLPQYREWGARVLVLSGVLAPGRALDHLDLLRQDPGMTWQFYGLQATALELRARVLNDSKCQDADERIRWAHIDDEITRIPGIDLIDTTDLSVDEVVSAVAAREMERCGLLDLPGRLPAARPASGLAAVSTKAARSCARRALAGAGFAGRVLDDTVEDLLAAELDGASSHGLLRVPEYAAAAAAGELCPSAEPSVITTPGGAVVDARRAPAVVVRRSLIATLIAQSERHSCAVVGLRRAAHIGRLLPLAEQATAAGLVLLGFSNFSGAGQKVAPPGATEGRLATNPLVMACPAQPGSPVVLDMSTSATSEGAIRSAHLRGALVQAGLMQDRRGRPEREPGRLYSTPPQASLTPLGGVASHKGYGLAVMVEVLAGVVAGGGYVGPANALPGNSGLFLAFPVTALGRTMAEIGTDIAELARYLKSCPVRPGYPAPRLPGWRHQSPERSEVINIPRGLWQEIQDLAADGAAVSDSARYTHPSRPIEAR